MAKRQKIFTKSGVTLLVEKYIAGDYIEITIQIKNHKKCMLHWGLRHHTHSSWHVPPESIWPEGTRAFNEVAVQTPFTSRNNAAYITIKLGKKLDFSSIDFVLFFPEESHWDNNCGQNYRIEIPGPARSPISRLEEIKQEIKQEKICYEQLYHVETHGNLKVIVTKENHRYHIFLFTDIPSPLILHWGIAKSSRYEWTLPPSSIYPPGTTTFRNKSAETPFANERGLGRLQIEINEQEAPVGISFVLKETNTGHWLKDHSHNFFIPIALTPGHEGVLSNPELTVLADEIIGKEMSRNSWTLMHRFNLCYEFLDRVQSVEGLALIFVWLRFSAIRQLDWQRNYNTKPRELSHSLDRLSSKLADRYIKRPGDKEFIRLILTTMGRGGEGQRIRDEILHIMHRHHIKEVSGHFVEEWHQKLHNNTTPDDVVICEAYLDFFRSDGNLDVFYKTLQAGGVTKERLESYERPIRSHPDFIPHLKDALIHDIEHFLGILKAVHSGTDLGAAIQAARYALDTELHDLMDFIWSHRNDQKMPVCILVEKVTEARVRLAKQMKNHKNTRDLLFLDLALENFLRVLVERSFASLSKDQTVELIELVLRSFCLSYHKAEFESCLRHWERLKETPSFSRIWSLQAKAIIDRLTHSLGDFNDRYHQILQPKADFLGKAFHADSWTISLFSQEIVRGSLAFALSILFHRLDPELRRIADLGNWQIISPGQAVGQLAVVEELSSVQGKRFDQPTILIVNKVGGNEEIPEGITAIITLDTTDVLSHVAIRARNIPVLFATCYDPETFDRLKSLSGDFFKIETDTAGEVKFEKISRDAHYQSNGTHTFQKVLLKPVFATYAISSSEFNEKSIGGKSLNLKHLQERLSGWLRVPTSVAIPFGVFEKVLLEEKNRTLAHRYEKMARIISEKPEAVNEEVLSELRETILAMNPPEELISSLRKVMKEARLPWPVNWEDAWRCIKHVWSSMWNQRAFLSRKARGIPHDSLYMAVLIQEVIEAEYSFVIHTVNPLTQDRNEIYAEVIVGLGETLVADYPGRALSFKSKKDGQESQLLSFPSKSFGLFGSGLIFRSDSSGEDLPGYAGAGLYDSVMLPPAHELLLDYTDIQLLWDEHFRRDFLNRLTSIAIEIENAMEYPQDIEGAYCRGEFYIVQTRPQVGIKND